MKKSRSVVTLAVNVERVGNVDSDNARHQRSHFARQMQLFGDLTDQEAPRQRAQQDQFGAAGDLVKQPRQDIAAEDPRSRPGRPTRAIESRITLTSRLPRFGCTAETGFAKISCKAPEH